MVNWFDIFKNKKQGFCTIGFGKVNCYRFILEGMTKLQLFFNEKSRFLRKKVKHTVLSEIVWYNNQHSMIDINKKEILLI